MTSGHDRKSKKVLPVSQKFLKNNFGKRKMILFDDGKQIHYSIVFEVLFYLFRRFYLSDHY